MLWSASQDPKVYQSNVAENAIFVLPFSSGVLDKAQCIEMVSKNDYAWDIFKFENVKMVVENDHFVVMVYLGTASKPSQSYRALVSSTYVKREGAWMLLFHQQTPIS